MNKAAHIYGSNTSEMVQQSLPLAFIHGEAFITKPADLFIPPDALAIILEEFEGPLDLLLYLIKKQKFDILDIPIAPITAQYMVYVELMKNVQLELAGEYLVMSAILAEIKSRLLLPKHDVGDDDEDPRAELVRRLQEYEVIKVAAENFDALPQLERDYHRAQAVMPANYVPSVILAEVELADMLNALQDVLKRSAAFSHHHIKKEVLSTRERMTIVLQKLKQTTKDKPYLEFSQLFSFDEGKTGVVVTFLAILELVKEAIIECVQSSQMIQVRIKS